MTTNLRPGRFLFVSFPAVAHVAPMASIANELASRGHEVATIGFEYFKGPLSDHIKFEAIPPSDEYHQFLQSESSESVRSTAAAFVAGWENRAVPLFWAMFEPVANFVAVFKPNVMLVDQHALAGALVARQVGLPWATSAPSGELIAEKAATDFDKTAEWLKGLQDDLLSSAGVEPAAQFEPSTQLVLLYTARAFAGTEMSFPAHYRFVGANIERRQDDTPFPWDALDSKRKRVYVSLGSIVGARGGRLLNALVDALRDQPVQVIVSDPASAIEAAPDNFIVQKWVPQIELLPKVDAVVTHGGSSVNEALAFGIPLVVAPYHLDNFIYAGKVVDSGAGIRVRFARSGPDELRNAVMEVLDNPSYRLAAERIRDSSQAAGGTAAAADALESLLRPEDERVGRS